MDTLKKLVSKVLDLTHVADGLPYNLGTLVHTAIVGFVGLVLLHVTGVLPVTGVTTVLTTAVLLTVEELLDEYLS